jgi:hypothetical protein
VQQVLCSGILHWYFDCSLTKSFQVKNISACLIDIDLVLLKHLEDGWICVDSKARVLLFDLFDLTLEYSNSSTKLLLKSVIVFFDFSSLKSDVDSFSEF